MIIPVDNDGEDRKWIRIDKNRNTVKLLYTKMELEYIEDELLRTQVSYLPNPT